MRFFFFFFFPKLSRCKSSPSGSLDALSVSPPLSISVFFLTKARSWSLLWCTVEVAAAFKSATSSATPSIVWSSALIFMHSHSGRCSSRGFSISFLIFNTFSSSFGFTWTDPLSATIDTSLRSSLESIKIDLKIFGSWNLNKGYHFATEPKCCSIRARKGILITMEYVHLANIVTK